MRWLQGSALRVERDVVQTKAGRACKVVRSQAEPGNEKRERACCKFQEPC
jgi:hypothetical protein